MMQIESLIKNDRYNIDLWNAIIQNSTSTPSSHRNVFESFLSVFPTAARYWKTFIDREIISKNYQLVERLFKKCLFSCLDVDLWKSYISYIRIVKRGTINEQKDINTAYEFVIKNIGMDVNSASIWSDHISFLKNEMTGVIESERIKAIRGVYHLALVTPMSGVDQIWREYDSWEHLNDKSMAKGMLAGLYQQHQNAKSCCLHRKRLKRSILPGMLARPPYGANKSYERDYLQLIHWMKLIDYEKSNPQKLGPKQLEERVVFTYKQSLMYLRFFPDIWDSYAKYLFDRHTIDDAVGIYERAISALPENLEIHFRYAEFLELKKKIKAAEKVYERLLTTSKQNPLVFVHFQWFCRRCISKEKARKVFIRAKSLDNCSYHIYLSSAYIEHFTNKEPKISLKILTLGLNRYIQNTTFVIEYLNFLEKNCDRNNMREIYERILTEISNEKSEKIWDKYISFEMKSCSDLKVVSSLFERRAQSLDLPQTKIQINLLKKYSFKDLLPCPAEYLETIKKVLNTKIQDIPIDSNKKIGVGSNKKFKSYTLKAISTFFNPKLKSGVPFLKSIKDNVSKENKKMNGNDISEETKTNDKPQELPYAIRKLIEKLPNRLCVQGIPVAVSQLFEKIKSVDVSFKNVKNDSKNENEEESEMRITGDLFQQRRNLKKIPGID